MTHSAILFVGDSERDDTLFYLTHFLAGDQFVYLRATDRELLVVNAMERGRAEKEGRVPKVLTFDDFDYQQLAARLKDRQQALAAVVENVVRSTGTQHVHVGADFPLLYADHLRQAGIGVEIDPNLFSAERRSKNSDELASIEHAQRAAEYATQRAIDLLARSEIRDNALFVDDAPLTAERVRIEIEMALLEREMGAPAGIIVAGGLGSADPHWRGAGPLLAHQPIVLDIFPRSKSDRYFADMTRTVVKGTASELVRRMYTATAQALHTAMSIIGPGVNGRDVHDAVVRVYEKTGFAGEGSGPRFIHGTGHGVGLAIHESPRLGSADTELRPGDVVTVEPGLYDPQVGGVRLEDLVVVTETGYRNLTTFPLTLEI